MSLKQKILTVINHPQPLKKIFRGIKIRINKARGKFWCATRSVSNKKAFNEIGLTLQESFYQKFDEELKAAQKEVENCPVEMGGPGNLDLIYHLTKALKAIRIIETGVAYGWSSLAFLLAIKENGGGELISTDMPHNEERDNYVGCIVPKELNKYWTIIKEADETALGKAFKILPEIDICHYDSDKTYEGRMFAYSKLWEALRPGGVLISDDINDNLAFKDFSKKVNIDPTVIKTQIPNSKDKYVGVLIKNGKRKIKK